MTSSFFHTPLFSRVNGILCESLHSLIPPDPVDEVVHPGVDPREPLPGAVHPERRDPDHGPPAAHRGHEGAAGVARAGVAHAVAAGAHLMNV